MAVQTASACVDSCTPFYLHFYKFASWMVASIWTQSNLLCPTMGKTLILSDESGHWIDSPLRQFWGWCCCVSLGWLVTESSSGPWDTLPPYCHSVNRNRTPFSCEQNQMFYPDTSFRPCHRFTHQGQQRPDTSGQRDGVWVREGGDLLGSSPSSGVGVVLAWTGRAQHQVQDGD